MTGAAPWQSADIYRSDTEYKPTDLVAISDGKVGTLTVRRGRTRVRSGSVIARSHPALFVAIDSPTGAEAIRTIGADDQRTQPTRDLREPAPPLVVGAEPAAPWKL
ncbi:MAG TPA: hypothetical protein VLV46_06555 [Gaiellaceae bacterium]|nr:hypothetical protein [Gaiellaceae bacterium]